MRTLSPAALLPLLPLVLVACSKSPDPLAGKWDVAVPDDAEKGAVNVFEFGDGKVKFRRRTAVLGIGQVEVTTNGTYTIDGPEVTLTRGASTIDASSIANAKLREQTVKVMEERVKATEGQPLKLTLKAESPDKIVLGEPNGSITLTRSR